MSIPKKGTRKIIVGAEPFIWLIRKKATYIQSCYPEGLINIAIEHAQEPGSNLIIETDRLHPEGFSFADGELVPVQPQDESAEIRLWRIEQRYPINSILPSDVALWIEQALEIGWMPKKSGKPFYVAVAEGSLKRSKF
jgi:hypothetical protein